MKHIITRLQFSTLKRGCEIVKIFFCTILILILISGCIEFLSIKQPTTASPNELITVSLTVRTGGSATSPCFGVSLPIAWTVPGDSLRISGIYNETFKFDSLASAKFNEETPVTDGYYWWIASGNEVSGERGEVYAELHIQSDNQRGVFYLDYIGGRLNSQEFINYIHIFRRSNEHPIAILDTPMNSPSSANDAVTYGKNMSYTFNPSDFSFSDSDGHEFMGIRITSIETAGDLEYDSVDVVENMDCLNVSKLTFTPDINTTGFPYATFSFQVIDNSYDYSLENYTMEINILDGESDFYVSPTGSAGNSGLSADSPFRTIARALAIISADASHPRKVYIYNGVYSPSKTEERFPLEIPAYVSLFGESESSVILDSEKSGHNNARYYDTTYSMIIIEDVKGVSIENLTIRNSREEGINCDNSDVDFINMTVMGNSGGGFYIDNSTSTLKNVRISENWAPSDGGGIFLLDANVILENITICNNFARENGGGISCSRRGNLSFDEENRCNIYLNQSGSRGNDLYNGSKNNISVVLDTFTVLNPTEYHASPLNAFTFDILHGYENPTNVKKTKLVPTKFALYQNYPNPFNPTTTIQYDLPKSAKVVLKIYNLLGNEVRTLVNVNQTAGAKTVTWDGRNRFGELVSSGIYVYHLKVGNEIKSKKMVLMR